MNPARELKSLLSFLFSPHGWIGRVNYLRGVAIVILSNWLLIGAFGFYGGSVLLGALAPLLTLPTMVCITTKRLHGLNRSGWIQAPVRAIAAAAVVLYALAFHDGKLDPAPLRFAGPLVLLAVIGEVGLFLWLALARNRPAEGPLEEVFD